MGKFIDLTGQKFSKLLVIERSYRPKGSQKSSFWRCLCDCGNEKVIRGGNLKGNRTKSCGCLTKKQSPKNGRKTLRDYGYSTFKYCFIQYKQRAKNKNIEFEIDMELFKEITQMDCFYCGKPPSNMRKSRSNNGDYIYNGIDRIDSSKGYNLDNLVSCCWQCNQAKKNYSQQEFYSWIDRVYNHIHGLDKGEN